MAGISKVNKFLSDKFAQFIARFPFVQPWFTDLNYIAPFPSPRWDIDIDIDFNSLANILKLKSVH